jgi:hypothetical protein
MIEVLASNIKDSNEKKFYEILKRNKQKIKSLILKTKTKEIKLDEVYKVNFIGGEDKKGQKSDFIIYYSQNKEFKVSLKKIKFGEWESADSLIGDVVAEKILNYAIEQLDGNSNRNFLVDHIPVSGKKTKYSYDIVDTRTKKKIGLAYKCGISDAEKVCFGDDILGNGAIMVKTFKEDIKPNSSEELTIFCDRLIENIREIPTEIYPYFHVRGRSQRRDVQRFPGIRVEARPKKEISNVIFIEKPLRR